MRVIALLKEGRPPSSGTFSRCTMTTRLWGAVESVERQFHFTVQPTGMMMRASPARNPLISADGAPGFLVTSMLRDAVRPALSTCSQEDESEATLESPGAGSSGCRRRGCLCSRGARQQRGTDWPDQEETGKGRSEHHLPCSWHMPGSWMSCVAFPHQRPSSIPDSGVGLEGNSASSGWLDCHGVIGSRSEMA